MPNEIDNKKVFSDWDGQTSWEWDNPKTLYFEPVAGLGNRLRALGTSSPWSARNPCHWLALSMSEFTQIGYQLN